MSLNLAKWVTQAVSLFFPYGPRPFQSIAAVHRQVLTWQAQEVIVWLVETGQTESFRRPQGMPCRALL